MSAMDEGSFECNWKKGYQYPVTYKVLTWVRVLTLILALALGVGWNYLTFYPPFAHGNLTISPVLVAIDLPLTALIVYLIWWAFSSRIILSEDAIEQSRPFMRRVLRVSDIKGRRYVSGRSSAPMIVPRSGTPMSIDSASYGLDDRFDAWFKRFPDLKALEQKQEWERIRSDPALGATPAERVAKVTQRQGVLLTWGIALTVLAIITMGMIFVTEQVSGLLVLTTAVLPACGTLLMLRYKDEFQSTVRGNAAASLSLPLILPVISLGLLATDASGVVDSGKAISLGVIVGLPCLIAIQFAYGKGVATWRQRLAGGLIFGPYICLYCGSVLALGNVLLDKAAVPVYQAQVVGRYLVRGKSGAQHYLRLAAWGPMQDGSHLRVSGERYYEVHKGDIVCMSLHPGKFGLRWVHSVDCNTSGESEQ
jgi:hypothetical protein